MDALPKSLRERWREISLREIARKLAFDTDDASRDAAKATTSGDQAALEDFRRSLPASLRPAFDTVKDWGNESSSPFPFDLKYALRWIFNRVMSLGWTPERFDSFDRHRGDGDRMSHQDERMGKKYQWIAFHEFTARVSDSFEFRSDSTGDGESSYDAPWQLHRRDIDPSYLGHGGLRDDGSRSWWQPNQASADTWRRATSDSEWVATTHGLLALERIVNPQGATGDWLWLRGNVRWREPDRLGEDPEDRSRRMIHHWITAYVVRASDRAELVQWLTGRDLWSLHLHETFSPTQVFLGEFASATAFRAQYGFDGSWTRNRGLLPVPVIMPAVRYHWESNGYDASVENIIELSIPAPALLGLGDNLWRPPRSQALYLNPSLTQPGPDALLARTAPFRHWLQRHKLDAVWVMTGEKIVIQESFRARDDDWAGHLEFSTVGYFEGTKWHESRVAMLNRGEHQRTLLNE